MPLVKGRYKTLNGDWVRAGAPAGVFAESCPKLLASADCAIAATGVELAVGISLDPGDTVTTVTFVTGATALASGTAGYVVLRDPAGNKLAQTADFTSTARAANTKYSVTLATAVTATVAGLYIVGISFTASTVPTLRGVNLANAAIANAGVTISQSHGSAVAGTAPATVASPTGTAVVPYLIIS
jgi:hypothetical protein